jgi:hypothetical protein
MEGFDHILNWKLLGGSHLFPGKDGGTCINEAAVVAAGFEYRPIRNVRDMPSCFSRPICQLAMSLNDEAGGRDRQRLLPFVTRLACADTEEIEQQRQTYISSLVPRYMSLDRGIEILEGALAIGRQADPLALPEMEARMSAAKEKGSTATSKADKPLFGTFKNLLNAL